MRGFFAALRMTTKTEADSLRERKTREQTTTEILSEAQNDGQQQKQIRGFFAALRMTTKTETDSSATLRNDKQEDRQGQGQRRSFWLRQNDDIR